MEEALEMMREAGQGEMRVELANGKFQVHAVQFYGCLAKSDEDRALLVRIMVAHCGKVEKEYNEYSTFKTMSLGAQKEGTRVVLLTASECKKVGEKVVKEVRKVERVIKPAEVETVDQEVEVKTPIWDCGRSLFERAEYQPNG